MHRRGKSIPIAVHSHFDPGIGDHGYDGGDRAICGNHTASVAGEEESPKAAARVADGEDRPLVPGQSFDGADLLEAGFALDGAGNAVSRFARRAQCRSEAHTSELQSLMRISYAVFCLKKTTNNKRSKISSLQTPHRS